MPLLGSDTADMGYSDLSFALNGVLVDSVSHTPTGAIL